MKIVEQWSLTLTSNILKRFWADLKRRHVVRVVVTDDTGFELPTWVKSVVALPLIGLVGVAGWWVF